MNALYVIAIVSGAWFIIPKAIYAARALRPDMNLLMLVAVTLIGMLVEQGQMSLDGPLDLDWLPAVAEGESDPRDGITLRQLLNMSSGLYPVDSFKMEYATGSGLSYWAGASSVIGARRRGLIRQPGTFWDYENYDTLLAVYAMKHALGGEDSYHEYPRRALLDRIGMRNTLVSTDRFGDFIFSSQVYTNARDLARFGLLYLQQGMWDGERLSAQAALCTSEERPLSSDAASIAVISGLSGETLARASRAWMRAEPTLPLAISSRAWFASGVFAITRTLTAALR